MDKSLQNQLLRGAGNSPFSSRPRQSTGSLLSSTSINRKSLHNLAGKKSTVSGRYSVSGRSNQSQAIIARSEFNVVENFGVPLPVMVNEALTFAEKSSHISVSYSESGWAWAVSGRRLFTWQYKEHKNQQSPKSDFSSHRTPQRRTAATCRELTLPHCDIGHKASLIYVFIPENQHNVASCLAVSPTGDVRFWHSIAHDGSSVDQNGILDGQEFHQLLNIGVQSYVLATTTCNLVLLQIQTVNGRPTIKYKSVKPPSGFLGGISRRFSMMIGMNSGTEKENKFVTINAIKVSSSEVLITILADRFIQRWIFSVNGNEQFIYEDHDITRKIRDEFYTKFWNGREPNDIELHMLDMIVNEETVYVLCGAINNSTAPQMHYAIVVMNTDTDFMKIIQFIPLKLSQFCNLDSRNRDSSDSLKIKFIINRNIAYLYGDTTIYPVNLNAPNSGDMDAEKIDFQNTSDSILHGKVCGNIPLFFTKSHGLVCITASDFDPSDFMNSSYNPDVFTMPFSPADGTLQNSIMSPSNSTIGGSGNLMMYDLDPDEILGDNGNEDLVAQMKAAFVYHMKRNTNASNAILKDILPSDDTLEVVDSILDKTVVAIAEDLAEDIPAADPRWEVQFENTNRHALGSSNSLQILTQLKEKSMALNHFIEFLHNCGLWERMNAISHRGSLKSTCHIIADIAEKIVAAIALKKVQGQYPKLIEQMIQMVVSEWHEGVPGNLVAQDIFYVKLTRIQDIFHAISNVADKKVESQLSAAAVALDLSELNSIVTNILNEVQQFRESKSDLFALPLDKKDSFEYLPWTAMSGKNGLKDKLLHFIDLTLKFGTRSTGEPEIRQKLYQQLVLIIDFVLDGRKNYLDSVKDSDKYSVLLQQYESQRRDLIFPLVEDEQYELATKLAEKYLDFQVLVVVCDKTDNQNRLDKYIKKYQEYDFSQFAINWHLRQNRQGDLFEKFKENQAALSQFLGDHPSLAWIQLIFNGDLDRASKILYQLAQDEMEYVTRKKSMLSLSKLASIAADSDLALQISEINTDLKLIQYQDMLPINVLKAYGYDVENPKVLKPEEIINLFVCEENETVSENDFRMALELLAYVDSPFDIRHKVWCAAILRDSWTDFDMNAPTARLEEMLFFKLIEACYFSYGNLEFLPPMEEFILSADLDELVHDKSFQYLLKLGYEYVMTMYPNQKIEMEQD